MNDREIDAARVEAEHLAEVHVVRHWLYLFSVLGAGLLLMVGLIALLDAMTP